MDLNNAVRGSIFFPRFLPSFSRLGYCSRRWLWDAELPDFAGQEWVVTGASSGIGRAIALRAAGAGARVHVVARSEARLASLTDEVPEYLRAWTADLSSMASVSALAESLAGELKKVDVLVNNVGLMLQQREETPDGLEKSFATNLLGHYLLTEQLREAGALGDAVVVNMSSGGMYNVALDLDQLQGGRAFDGTFTYAYQKRAQVALNQWWRERGVNSYVMHPGWVDTPGVQTAMPEFYLATRPLLRDAEQGADTAIWLAAKRPEQPSADGIWFDRMPRSAHYLPGTRAGANGAALVGYLEGALKAVRDRSRQAVMNTSNSEAMGSSAP
jgi:dehydrogenase/reductase SDR family protein 12